MFLTGVALAVAVVPEGLPAVVTLTLALGVRQMVRRRVLLRRLHAAETLGSVTVICTDKTGTLTRNEMTVRRLWLADGEVEVTGVGYEPTGTFLREGQEIAPLEHPALRALLEVADRCNRARLEEAPEGWRVVGDPTEGALRVLARKARLPGEAPQPRRLFPFSSARKRMTTVLEQEGRRTALMKGAPEVVVERCTALQVGSRVLPLTPHRREEVFLAYRRMAEEGLRVLAFARRDLPPSLPLEAEAVEQDLTLLGLAGLQDPPRPEVPGAVRTALSAGIRILVITGDAGSTALAIARQIGLPVEEVLTGPEVDRMGDADLAEALRRPVLLARTTPEHKLRVVSLLQAQGEVVAMTGDGVNDAPALRRADVGVAMGLRGTDTARASADIVLLDDNFASIVAGVEEGRRQHDNVRKFVRYLLSANLAEVFLLLGGLALGWPLVLLPAQILWVNLVTDSATALALGLEPADRQVMRRPPIPPRSPILGGFALTALLGLSLFLTLMGLGAFAWGLRDGSVEQARSLAFTALVVGEVVNALNFRSFTEPLPVRGWLSNPWLLAAVGGMLGLQALALLLPPLQTALHTTPLGAGAWAGLLGLSLLPLAVGEAWRWYRWRRALHPRPTELARPR